jgi:DNA-binding winged helix-turn-helix (wHTH) protein/Tol biopolymer transport system component
VCFGAKLGLLGWWGIVAVVENPNRLVQFGVFELDTKAGELRRNGSKVRLQEQPLQVLLVLLEQPGEIVSREELRKRLWPGDTFVDFDHSLNAAIRRLRDALGDSAENPRFVETVARRGYRFLAPVNGGSAVAIAGPPSVPAKIVHTKWLAVSAGLLVVALVLGWWIGRHRTSETAGVPSLQRLTANAAEAPVLGGAISPDGKYLAFADKTGFYLRQIATGETHSIELPSGFNARPASWFPDGTHLVATWAATPNDPPAIWNILILGGAPRKLADAGAFPAVSPDGSQIAYLVGGSLSRALWVMQADGSNPHQIRERDGALIGGPRWSPDANYLVYVAGKYHAGAQYVDAQIEALNLKSGNRHVVLSTARLFHSVTWTAKNKLVYAAGERPPNQDDANLWEVQIDPNSAKPVGSPRRLTSDPGYVSDFSSTADGTRVAFFKHTIQPDVYVANVEPDDQISTPSRLTLDERQDFPSAWTRDGKSILFMSDRDGTFHIFRQAIDQGSPDLLVGGNDQLVIPRLTPDGSAILYLISSKWEQRPMNVRMMRIPVDGGAPQNVLSAPEISNHQCAVAPATLCLYSTIDQHEIRFYRFDPFTGSTEPLPQLTRKDEDFYSFNWSLSPDGRTLAMAKKLSMDQAAVIRLISIGDNTETVLPVPGWAFLSSLDWSTDGKSLWVSASTTQESSALLNIKMNGQVRTALEDKKMKIGWAIQSPDGNRVALWEASGASNVWMLEGL